VLSGDASAARSWVSTRQTWCWMLEGRSLPRAARREKVRTKGGKNKRTRNSKTRTKTGEQNRNEDVNDSDRTTQHATVPRPTETGRHSQDGGRVAHKIDSFARARARINIVRLDFGSLPSVSLAASYISSLLVPLILPTRSSNPSRPIPTP